MPDSKWIVAVCHLCKKAVDINKLVLDPRNHDFILFLLTKWLKQGYYIEIRHACQFPLTIEPCNCVSEDSHPEKAIRTLMSLIEEASQLNNGCLDELVHEAASEIAAGVNNDGTSAQVEFITSRFGDRGATEIIKTILDELRKEELGEDEKEEDEE